MRVHWREKLVPPKAAKAVVYVRSSPRERQTGLGPAAQREACDRWASGQGVEIVDQFDDIDVSGADDLGERLGLVQAIDALGSLGARYLLVAKRDRLARDVVIAAMTERLVERKGATIVSADGTGNGTTPEHQLMRRIVDAFAEYERMVISARTRAALAVKKARGEWISGSVPYGYHLADDGKRLIPDKAEQEVIGYMTAWWLAEELSLAEVVRRLNATGIAPRRLGRRKKAFWELPLIRRILIREGVYYARGQSRSPARNGRYVRRDPADS